MGMKFYKATGPNGFAFYDKTTRYVSGTVLEHPNPQMTTDPCGRGYHCSPHLHQTRKYISGDLRACEFFEVEIEPEDIIARGDDKIRAKRLTVVKALSEADFLIVRGRLDEVLGVDDYGYGDGSGSGYGYGDGSGYGSGYGDGSGSGSGYGYGDGSGYGSGYGDGSGSGYGYGYGDGSGYGDGYGDGSGYGYGDGDGSGYGYGYGSGSGYGYGYGDGSGYGYGSGDGLRL